MRYVRSNCHAKIEAAKDAITRLFSERKGGSFNWAEDSNPKAVATLSQGGGFQPSGLAVPNYQGLY
jgi:hypothetical protein